MLLLQRKSVMLIYASIAKTITFTYLCALTLDRTMAELIIQSKVHSTLISICNFCHIFYAILLSITVNLDLPKHLQRNAKHGIEYKNKKKKRNPIIITNLAHLSRVSFTFEDFKMTTFSA